MMAENFKVNSSKVVCEVIDGEVVIVNLQQGDYYSLLNSGADIWRGIERGMSRIEIIEELVQRYDASRETIEKAVDALIEELRQEEIIIVEGSNSSESVNLLNNSTPPEANSEKLSFEPPSLGKYTDMEELLALDPIHEVDEMGWPNAKAAQV